MWSKQPLVCDVDLPPDDRSLYYQILRKEYYDLLNSVKSYWSTKSTLNFSEDIFHDTLINCINTCSQMTSKNNIYRYVCKSYYTNMIRELDYSRQKLCITLDHTSYHITTKDGSFDTVKREIFEYIKNDKGEVVMNAVKDYLNGRTFGELVEKYNIKYKAKELKDYIKNVIKMHTY